MRCAQFLEFADAAIGEDGVADREGLIDNQDLGIHMDGGGKGQSHVHAAGIFFDRPVDEFADFGEGFDGGHGFVDLAAAQAHDLAIQDRRFRGRRIPD